LSASRRAAILRYWSAGVLLIGLLAAEIVYVLAADEADASDALASGRMYQHNLQVMGGKAAVLFDGFDRWFAGLWHGRPLAYTVAVLTVVAAATLYVASRLCEPATRRR
jgi:hypothetical protein